MDTLIGSSLGQYQLLEEIGRGGMARVYRAFQASLNRSVAIKVLPPMLASDASFLNRFRREANVVGTLAHPNILPVYDYGEQASTGILYIVMMYVAGGTLRDRMGQPLDLPTIGKIIGQLADALDYAHRQGIIHRDIKPTNVLMARPDWPLLSDFGIAFAAQQQALTMTGAGLGTPEYMSPEQGQGQKVDSRSDLYSLGVILFELLTGRVPYTAETAIGVIHQHVFEPVPLPSQLRPDIHPAVEHVVVRAMAKRAEDRYQSGADLRSALDDAIIFVRGAPPTPQPPIPAVTTVLPPPSMPYPSQQYPSSVPSAPSYPEPTPPYIDTPAPSRRRSPYLIGCLAGGGVLIGLIAVCSIVALAFGGNSSTFAGLLGPTPTATLVPIPTRIPSPSPLPSPTQVPSGGTIFSDDFKNQNRADWVLDADQQQVFFEGDTLHVVSRKAETAYRTWPRKATPAGDVIIEATISKIDGPDSYGYGIVFRDDGQSNYYFFSVTGGGSFRLERYNNKSTEASKWETVIDWTKSNAIEKFNNGTNRLKVIAQGSTIKIFANDQQLGQAEDAALASGTYGILVGTTGVHVAVSEFKVTRP